MGPGKQVWERAKINLQLISGNGSEVRVVTEQVHQPPDVLHAEVQHPQAPTAAHDGAPAGCTRGILSCPCALAPCGGRVPSPMPSTSQSRNKLRPVRCCRTMCKLQVP